MSAAKRDLTIERGSSKSFTLRIVDVFGDTVAVGSPSTHKAEIREAHRKPLVAAFTVAPVADTPGTVRFTLDGDDSLALDVARQYQWDYFFTDTAGTRKRLLYGNVTVEPNISYLT
jgi:hypothetical protein